MRCGNGAPLSSDGRAYSELASMVEQLTSLCSQLHVDDSSHSGNHSLEELLLQLNQLLVLTRDSIEQPHSSSPVQLPTAKPQVLSSQTTSTPPRNKSSAASRGGRGRGRGKGWRHRHTPGVLIVRRNMSSKRRWQSHKNGHSTEPGYARPTFSSSLRQSPHKPSIDSRNKQPACPSPPHSPPLQCLNNVSPVLSPSDPTTTDTCDKQETGGGKERKAEEEEEVKLCHPLPHDLAERELTR